MTPEEMLDLSTHVARNLAGWHVSAVEDLAQDGVVALLQAPRFAGTGSGEGYLRWRARNGMVDRLRQEPAYSPHRKALLARTVSLDALESALGDELGSFESLTVPATHGGALERSDLARHVRRAIATLPARRREVIVRYYFRGELMTEIGAAMGVCESRVSQLLTDARARLRRVLLKEKPCDERCA